MPKPLACRYLLAMLFGRRFCSAAFATLLGLCAATISLAQQPAQAVVQTKHSAKPTDPTLDPLRAPSVTLLKDKIKLPPAPDGVVDLRFDEILKPPGARGLEFTDKAKELDGKKVRILGYMARMPYAYPGMLKLAPMPVTIFLEYGQADDLPPSTVTVYTPELPKRKVPYTRGLLLLTGRLELGYKEGIDGAVSWVRLYLDKPVDSEQGHGPPAREEGLAAAAPETWSYGATANPTKQANQERSRDAGNTSDTRRMQPPAADLGTSKPSQP
jgi:hypothetical protein